MQRKRWSVTLIILALIAASPALGQIRWFESYTGGYADRAMKQDKNLRTALLITEMMGPSGICIDFTNNVPKANKGKVSASIGVFPDDDDEPDYIADVSGRMSDNNLFECVLIDFLLPDDVVMAEIKAKKFKKLQPGHLFSTGLFVGEEALAATPLRADLTERQREGLRRFAARDRRTMVRIER